MQQSVIRPYVDIAPPKTIIMLKRKNSAYEIGLGHFDMPLAEAEKILQGLGNGVKYTVDPECFLLPKNTRSLTIHYSCFVMVGDRHFICDKAKKTFLEITYRVFTPISELPQA